MAVLLIIGSVLVAAVGAVAVAVVGKFGGVVKAIIPGKYIKVKHCLIFSSAYFK